jgi:hypothetical protein
MSQLSTNVLVQRHVNDNGGYFFTRTWHEFKDGFGNETGNYWIGNEKLHLLTKDGQYSMRVDMQLQSDSSWKFAMYETFIVDNETAGYKLHIGGCTTDVEDAFQAAGTASNGTSYSLDGATFMTPFNMPGGITPYCTYMTKVGFWYPISNSVCSLVHINEASTAFAWGQRRLLASSMTLILKF